MDLAPSTPEREVLWVDKTNSIVLKKEVYKEGQLVGIIDVNTYELNIDISDEFFDDNIDTEAKANIYKEEADEGYREISLEQVEEKCGISPLVPSYVPDGFEMSSTGWRDLSVRGFPNDLPPEKAPVWYKPFYITYSNGISEINICEAKKYDVGIPDTDSLDIDTDGGAIIVETKMTRGRTGYYEPEKETFYFFLDDTKVRIRAELPVEELVKIAESIGKEKSEKKK